MTLRALARALLPCAAVPLAAAACGDRAPARDLRELVVRDSTYVDPRSMEPYSGSVFRPFPGDSMGNEIEGSLLDGTWHGDLVVYHESGRVRYMGSFDRGERCGAWTENARDVERESLVAQVRAEVETLGLYPPCPDDF